ncbi:YkvA family protein [Marinobacteraceae bacterium S3BR75-40.1]
MKSKRPGQPPEPFPSEIASYQGEYSESRFWDRVKHYSGRMGRKPLELALTLLYTLRDARTPAWCKTVIVGALGYFISLIDALPDLTPVLGYTDDVGVMLAALATLGLYVTPENRRKARDTTDRLLGLPPQDPDSTPSDSISGDE